MRVVVTEFMDEEALAAFESGLSVTYDPSLVEDRGATLAAVGEADAVIVRNRTLIDRELLDAAPKLRAVGRLGVGLDNIDLDACRTRAIAVLPATGANTLSVAEYVIGATMALVRGSFAARDEMIAGLWPRDALGRGGEVSGRVMGLLGFGGIAQAVAERARALGMALAAHDPFLPEDHPAWTGVERCGLGDLLARADVLSLHVPLTGETRGLLGADALGRMKPGAILVNTARGGIVDETALVAALTAGALGGAALDVFATEPLTAEAGARFRDCPNLILTPHIAGVTGEGNARVSHLTVENVRRALAGD
ncbi:MAG TPA: hydroxyacid dehydrogenase [Amaricoccus sp.]|uniref:hydroxyacid dehydrogenase n=1 Tax=Amaricoccus sp. TaxID=1872485 RepID=UPI002C0E8E25|nr:hydroxyacid dehydrogenase [Amaricoccus sp.]HMQ91570.1 hydroxyacid dehydrogenase [Amaricoccus sp.]HMR51104.1 hydroxyacid dehydrogenase [Amaricoccus sp.]HMR59733.1 hydroxyacid dehydrogenase [Amaricoccus sp.]HMT98148.1 hydroxyacid dehydrogenase [Amaricoccus sp.]